MTTLNDIKLIYPTFKWFKDNYSILNKATRVLLCGQSDVVKMYFNKDSDYYLLCGEITANNYFSNWLNGKNVWLSLSDILLLHKCLKKNAISIEYDDESFSLKFTDKEENTHDVKLVNISDISDVRRHIDVLSYLTTDIPFDESRLNSEIFTAYEKDGELIFKHEEGYEKILEHPSKKFIATQKNSTYSLSFSKIYGNIRYVSLNSYTENITLRQLFATI